jgi:hypothetical protein
MSVQNYADLISHRGHKLNIHTYYDENVAIECEDCYEVLLDYDKEGEG